MFRRADFSRVTKLAKLQSEKAQPGYRQHPGVTINARVIARGMTDVKKLIEHTSSNHFSEPAEEPAATGVNSEEIA